MIRLGRLNGFSARELEKFLNAFELCKVVMCTEAFGYAVTHSAYSDTSYTGIFIYTTLVSQDRVVNFQLETKPWWKRLFSKEIAREVPGVGVVLNRDYFIKLSVAEIARTIAHEFCHVCDFKHPYNDSKVRRESIPYRIGTIVYELAKAMPAKNSVALELAAIKETNS